jgi:phospholipase C
MVSTTRRQVLGAAAGGAALSLLPRSLHEAMAMPMRRGGLRAIEHVVVLMQENRSFDHYFGTMRGVRGFGDRAPLRLRGGTTIFEQPNPAGGSVLPFSLREAAERAGRPGSDIQYLGDLDHSWTGSTTAWAQGWNDDWIGVKTPATMTYYERRDIPLQYELAETFTFCDAYHCSVFGSTNPNRNYLVSGTTGYEPGSTARAVTNAAYDYDHAGYEWTTYAERLEAAGISWQVYQEWDNFTDNAIEYFVPFKRAGTKMLAAVDGGYRTTEEFYYALFDKPPEEQQRLLAQLEEGRASLTAAERSLFDRGMARSEPESLVPRLRADIAAGRLPRVSWLVPSAVDSEHPGASTPVGSANLMHELLDALASDRETWSRTVLFVNFDENDGYFDHVPPPVPPLPPGGEGDDHFEGKPIGLATRVPMTIVSPWTIGGHVCSEVSDHTSVVRFLERWTGVEEPNISPWRRTVCGDLTSAFDFDRQGRPPRLEQPGPVPEPIERWHPGAPADGALPPQERGRRPLRALPYAPGVSALVDGRGRLELTLRNRGDSAAHFAVYPYQGELDVPLHADVAREQRVRLEPPGDAFQLAVQGPNRFWYELAGTRSGAAAGVDVRPRAVPLRTVLALELENAGEEPVTLRLGALGYGRRRRAVRVRPGRTRSITWDTDRGWYDLEVTADEDGTFRRRLTGRVDNGRAGVSA